MAMIAYPQLYNTMGRIIDSREGVVGGQVKIAKFSGILNIVYDGYHFVFS